MRVNSVSQTNYQTSFNRSKNVSKVDNRQNLSSSYPKVVSFSDYMRSPISFLGKAKNKSQVIFIGAEVAPYSKKGGVGTVMKDYADAMPSENEVVISPYYGANVDSVGNITPAKDKDGDYVLPSKGTKLELVSEKTMQWGLSSNSQIKLFKEKNPQKKNVHYFVFNDQTAHFKAPYEGGFTYATGLGNVNRDDAHKWTGDPYAQFSKAAVELLPDVLKDKGENFQPATIICSDSQTAYVHEYMAKKSVKDSDDNVYSGIKPTYVGHNMGPGYCGETSKQNMFVNLGATPNQIRMVENDPIYQDGRLGDEYFKPFVQRTLDETGTASAVMIPIHYAGKETAKGEGYAKSFTVVSEEYAKSLAENPQAAHNIHNHLKQLSEQGTFTGIMNPLNDDTVDAAKHVPNQWYSKEPVTDSDGTVFQPLKTYPVNPTYQQMRDVKNQNKLNLLERLYAKDTRIVSGNPNKYANINPEWANIEGADTSEPIRKDLMEKIRTGHGDEVPLFVSWGRADTQKGHDITLKAFQKFAKTEEGKNAILVLGAGLDPNNPESQVITDTMTEILQDDDLKGRVVHIDGWAPAYALASCADAAIFSSRFEPCGLTDLEAMKYYCTPIVTNTQGLKQKNFDPRNEDEKVKATSYKSQHEFNLLASQVEPIVQCYADKDRARINEVKEEFPVFVKKDKNGNEVFDESVFIKFGNDYRKFHDAKLEEIAQKEAAGIHTPINWDNWDELSKDYDFKFKGFARNLKDDILIYEMADAIKACATAPQHEKETIFNNLKKLDTSWDSNNSLHPSGQSSIDMYKELHMQKDYSAPINEDILGFDDNAVKNAIAERQHDDMQGRIKTYLGGALTGLASALFFKSGSPEYHQDIKPLQEKIAKLENNIKIMGNNHKEQLRKYAAVGALAGAFLSFVVTKAFMTRRNESVTEGLNIYKLHPNTPFVPENLSNQSVENASAPHPNVVQLSSGNAAANSQFNSFSSFRQNLSKQA